MKCALADFSSRKEPEHEHVDEEGKLRLIGYPINFERLAHSIFTDSRQYIAADCYTTLHVLKIIADVGASMRPSHKEIILHHATLLNEAAQASLPYDTALKEVASRYMQVKAVLSYPEVRDALMNDQGWLGGTA